MTRAKGRRSRRPGSLRPQSRDQWSRFNIQRSCTLDGFESGSLHHPLDQAMFGFVHASRKPRPLVAALLVDDVNLVRYSWLAHRLFPVFLHRI
jgi:hypothetical protein